MQQIEIGKNEAGQRFDKFLFKYFKEAGSGFLYKMLRKKNITLNGKKSDGKEKLEEGDVVKIFMADETIAKFKGESTIPIVPEIPLDIIYEDEHILIINKPSGMLSQKAKDSDISANEYILSYLVHQGKIDKNELSTFKPSICNRLDRNTSGLLVAGKTLKGLQEMAEMLQERTVQKYYLAVVHGELTEKKKITGYLYKDEKANKVSVSSNPTKGSPIATEYEPIRSNKKFTLVKIHLITGKPHQIRAHLSSVGYPIVGDYKYGNRFINDEFKKKYGIKDQMLHSWQMVFPSLSDELEALSNQKIEAEPPIIFEEVLTGEGL
ncbi:MAG: RluA family pseudouridine synthase [Eubacterium sp.]|nr:RluA family pseudouridine synthase [Eubacterium sp.]